MDETIEKATIIITKNAELFLDAIRKKTSIDCKTIHPYTTDYPIFRPANTAYFEYKYYEGVLEWYIRDYLISSIIFELFKTIKPDIVENFYTPEPLVNPKIQIARFDYPNEIYGRDYPFAFIIETPTERIGYRYSSIDLNKRELRHLFHDYKISRIEIIDWSDNDGINTNKEKATNQNRCDGIDVDVVSLRSFFVKYYSEDVYNSYLIITREAVKQANNEIGFQTIPALSLRYVSNFKADFLQQLMNMPIETTHYYMFDRKGELTQATEPLLPENDYTIVKERVFNNELLKALVSGEKFARCFITSEYLYSVFKEIPSKSFDYSTVVTGYFKSVELLLDKIKDTWLNSSRYCDLWINGGSSKLVHKEGIDWCRKNPVTNGTQVKFVDEHKKEFRTEMGSLIWLLHDNVNGWYVSKEGKEIIHACLMNYDTGCRNKHLHKDIISNVKTIESIRSNTILCLLYLLGGCSLTGGSISEDREAFLIEDDEYGRLYKAILTMPRWITAFYIKFPDYEAIKAFRLFDQDSTEYDDDGRIISPIRFIRVDDFSEVQYGSNEEYYQIVSGKKQIAISRENMPERLWWIDIYNNIVEIEC